MTQVVKYDIETAVITALDAKYADVVIKDAASYAFVMSGLREYREHRLAVDEWHKGKKQSALEYSQALDAEKRRVKGLLEPGEQHLKDVRQVEDDRKAKIKAEKDRIEKERIDGIQAKIVDLERYPSLTTGLNSDSVASMCDAIVAVQITEEEYQEFTEQAKAAKLATLSALDDIYNDKVIQEQEAAERKAEIAQIEKLRAEQAKAEVKMHEELRKIELEKQAVQKIIDDEKEKRDRAEFERKAQEQAKEQAKRHAEQEAQQKEKESIAAQIEAKRQADLRPDKEKLIAFADMLTNLKLPVVKSKVAKMAVAEINERLDDLQSLIRDQAENM